MVYSGTLCITPVQCSPASSSSPWVITLVAPLSIPISTRRGVGNREHLTHYCSDQLRGDKYKDSCGKKDLKVVVPSLFTEANRPAADNADDEI